MHQHLLDLLVLMDHLVVQVSLDLLDPLVVMDLVVLVVVMGLLVHLDLLDPLVSRGGQHINGDE